MATNNTQDNNSAPPWRSTDQDGASGYQIYPIPAFMDNYIWCIRHPDGRAIIVDPGDGRPVLDYLQSQRLQLEAILITHHHGDHVGGLPTLLREYAVPVYGPKNSPTRRLDHWLEEGDRVQLLDLDFQVIRVPGHTLDHIAFITEIDGIPRLFCGDTLFAGGCGRLFEGTAAQLYQSLKRFDELPDHCLFYCAHEYTLANLAFAQRVMPGNPDLRQRIRECQAVCDQGNPTLPSTLGLERLTNPFLRCTDPEVIAAASHHANPEDRSPKAVFSILREWKNTFIS